MITERNIIVHELIGLQVEVVSGSRSKPHVGLKGEVIDETRNVLILRAEDSSIKKVPKDGQVFKFKLPDNSACVVYGRRILNRPENRLKRGYSKI